MAKKETTEKTLLADARADRRNSISNGSRKSGFRMGDLLLVILATSLIAVLILLGAEVIPSIRRSFSTYKEEIVFTVEYQMPPIEELPRANDQWVLLDSDGAVCTVRKVEYSLEEKVCSITLLRKNALYRDGEGYMIDETRIAVGSTLYFQCSGDQYFAVTVTALESERFPQVTEFTETTESQTPNENASSDNAGTEVPNA